MRSFVSRAVLGIGLILTACAPAAAPTASPAAPSQPTEKRAAVQSLRAAQVGLPASMSPAASAANIPLYAIMYDSLVWLNGKNEVQPWIAEKWSQPNPTTWRFNLRKDLTFSNGDKLTADDVEFTINLVLSEKMPQISQITNLTGAKKVDDYTIDVTTAVPDASVLPGLLYVWIMPKNYYTTQGKDGFTVKPIGSGPYELTEFRANDVANFKKRTAEHPFRKVTLTDLSVRSITEQTQMAAGLRTGELDIVYGSLRPDVVEGMSKTDAKITFRTTSNLSGLLSQPEAVMRKTPLQDKKVRLALNYAVDKEAIAKTLFRGYAESTGQMSTPSSLSWDTSVKPVPYDPAMAKKLLAEAGYPNGFKLEVGIEFTPQTIDPNIATAIQSNLKDVGIDAPLSSNELALFLDKYYGRNGQVKGDIFLQSTQDSNGFFTQIQGLYTCNKPLHWWCSPDFDKNMALANGEPDNAKRAVYMKQAIKAFTDDVAHINLIISSVFVVNTPKVGGFAWDNNIFWNMDKIYKIE